MGRWGPTLIWMGLIFILSSRQRITVSHTYAVNFLVFKTLHVIEYAILYTLMARSMVLSRKRPAHDALLIAFILTLIYAVSDEFHQTLVLSREGTPRDVLIDTVGITIMYVFIKTQARRLKKILV